MDEDATRTATTTWRALIDELDRTRRALVALGDTPPEEPSRSPHAADCAARLTTNGFCTCGFDASHGYDRHRPAEGFRDVGSAREIDLARRAAEEALDEYARLAFGWNAPDDEHTRHSLRALAETAIRDNDPASSTTEPCPTCDGAGCPECSDRFGPRWPDDEMCPNCVTPWKCNGPHKPAAGPQETE